MKKNGRHPVMFSVDHFRDVYVPPFTPYLDNFVNEDDPFAVCPLTMFMFRHSENLMDDYVIDEEIRRKVMRSISTLVRLHFVNFQEMDNFLYHAFERGIRGKPPLHPLIPEYIEHYNLGLKIREMYEKGQAALHRTG